jgi:hypothetical protein
MQLNVMVYLQWSTVLHWVDRLSPKVKAMIIYQTTSAHDAHPDHIIADSPFQTKGDPTPLRITGPLFSVGSNGRPCPASFLLGHKPNKPGRGKIGGDAITPSS